MPRPIIAEACGIEHKIGGSSALLAVDSCIERAAMCPRVNWDNAVKVICEKAPNEKAAGEPPITI